MNPELVVVMPIFNEEDNLASVLTEWVKAIRKEGAQFEIYAINDGSSDGTLNKLKSLQKDIPELRVLDKPNSGHGRSCRFGYDLAVASGCSWVLQIDSDGQCDPSYFKEFWNCRNDFDGVFGYRWTRGDGIARIAISRICQFSVFLLTGCNPHDANVPYRLIRSSVLSNAISVIPKDFDLHNIALSVVVHKIPNLRFSYKPIHFLPRTGGESTLNLKKIVGLGFTLLTSLPSLQKRITDLQRLHSPNA